MPVSRIDCFITPDDLGKSLHLDVMNGLFDVPKWLPPKWFYDSRGSELFERITRLEEYYPTRRERTILARHGNEIAHLAGATSLLELGAGAAEKTRLLLDALTRAGTLRSYVPVDVSGDFLRATVNRISKSYPELLVHGVVADHDRHLHLLPDDRRRLIAFLGSTLGNMASAERAHFLGALRVIMNRDDALLLGVDLVKDSDRLVRAYDDAAGVTAAFNRNVLHVLNRRLGADFVPDRYQHVAVWDADNEWIEMRLRPSQEQHVHVAALDLVVHFAADEQMRTEISAKFRRSRLENELAEAGLRMVRWWTDPQQDFAVCLVRPAGVDIGG